MTYKDNMLKLTHKFHKKDEWVKAFIDCVQAKINDVNTVLDRLINLSHFNRLDNEGCKWWANLLKIVLPASMTLSEKRAYIRAKWRAKGHNSITLIKNICSSWENGEVDAELENDNDGNLTIKLTFSGAYGIPSDVDTLLKMIDEVRPAHIPFTLDYNFLLIKDIHEVKTIAEMNNIEIKDFMGNR